jgi:hypothetical protein
VELQDKFPVFEQNGIRPFAISYDPVRTLRTFAETHRITYPLLSDVNSEVIRAFDIFNTLVPPDHRWYGVPFPGTYMVGADGIVTHKSFYAEYAVRDSVARMLQETYQIDGRGLPVRTVENDDLKTRVYLSSDTIRRGQVQTFTLDMTIKAGRHIYGPRVGGGYIPISLAFDAVDEVQFGPVVFPDPILTTVLGQEVPIYTKNIRLTAPIRNMGRVNFLVRARLNYQACDKVTCYLPQELTFEFPITTLQNV